MDAMGCTALISALGSQKSVASAFMLVFNDMVPPLPLSPSLPELCFERDWFGNHVLQTSIDLLPLSSINSQPSAKLPVQILLSASSHQVHPDCWPFLSNNVWALAGGGATCDAAH